jgi:Family of unknown function (DUF6519)
MPSDRSRRTDDLRDGYKEVVAQQGRVILDRDFNALQGLTDERIAADALDIVGPCGTPDDGFAISLPQLSPPGPPLWSSPGGFGPAGPQDFDFLISPGTMYVGGQRAVLLGQQAGRAITYSYYDQPDWIDPPDPVTFESPPGGNELVYLDLTEQEVSAAEDPDLLEVALGGPDTTARIKLMRRVRRLAVSSFDCAEAWQEAATHWLDRGLQIDPRTRRLEPAVRLQVGFTQDITATDPCDPVATGGYLGADNQLIRVQIGNSGSLGVGGESAQLLWGYDNASFIYRVTSISPDGTMLTLASNPPDAFHIPQTGQLVEILLTEAVLGKEPDETDPTRQRSILRVVAAPNGELRRLTQPYGPITPGDPTNYIVLDQPLGSDFISTPTPLFLRVWQAELSFDPAGDTVPLNDPARGASTGVQVTISVPPGEIATRGAFWLLAVRPTTPQAVYPERLLTEPQPPDGPRRWVCPLAVIDWQNASVTDCRCKFDNLVELSKRPRSCCTVSISPEDLTSTNTLQSIIDRAAGLAQSVTVCLSPGTYQLSQTLSLTSMHSNMIIEACNGGASLISTEDLGTGGFGSGLIHISGASNVTLRGLEIDLPATSGASTITMLGLMATGAPALLLERCSFQLAPPAVSARIIIGIALWLQADCSGLVLENCTFVSAVPITLTPASGIGRAGASASPHIAAGLPPRLAIEALLSRASEPAAAVAPSIVLTIGCIAISCQLGDCIVEDNSFSGFTGAFIGQIATGTARLTRNKVLNCVAGFWLVMTGYVPPSNSRMFPQLQGDVGELTSFEETGVLANVVDPLQAHPVPAGVGIAPSLLFVTDNQIEAMPGSDPGSTALMILANRALVQGQDTSVSLVIANNRLRTQAPPQGTPSTSPSAVPPAALLVIADSARCAVTGNLIFFEQGRAYAVGDSLDIITSSGTEAMLLAITGNVLLGNTTIGQLRRVDDPAGGNWLLYNSFLPVAP